VAACKVVNLFISPSLGVGTPNVKELQKEVQVHKSLKNQYILEFLHSEILDKEKEKEGWIPGLYLILELAVGGDLFDKIGMSPFWPRNVLTRKHLMWVYRKNWQSSILHRFARAW